MGCCNISIVTFMVVVVVLGSMASPTKAQQDCAQDLVSCVAYLNNTAQPSTECCTAINATVATKLPCLCGLYFTPGILEPYGGNTTSALRVAKACGADAVGVDKCKAYIGQAPTGSTPAAPAVPGADGNGSGRIAWTGLPALLFFWVSVMLY